SSEETSSAAMVEAPTVTTAPATNSAKDTDFNKFTIDDPAAERIKNYLVHNFLQRDIDLMEETDKQFQLYRIDLNEDGTSEYLVRFNSSYFCGGGGCTVLILNNNLTVINRFSVMQLPMFISKEKKNGWRTMMIKSEGSFREMVNTNGKYPKDPSTLPASKLAPSGHDEVLFAEGFPSKTYYFSEKPAQQMQKGMTQQRRNSVFQRTYNAGTFLFKVNATNSEVTPIHISTEALPRAFKKTFEIEGAVREGHLLDLNKDGFKELYLITQPTGDSGNLDIMGIASFRDKSAGEIYVKDTKEIRQVNSDKVFVENEELRRSFVQNGKAMSFKYRLRAGETGFILEAVKL
ncbi:MAG: hypothetical protein ACI9XB_004543, partial [Gammaproteobacteria bacterium]